MFNFSSKHPGFLVTFQVDLVLCIFWRPFNVSHTGNFSTWVAPLCHILFFMRLFCSPLFLFTNQSNMVSQSDTGTELKICKKNSPPQKNFKIPFRKFKNYWWSSLKKITRKSSCLEAKSKEMRGGINFYAVYKNLLFCCFCFVRSLFYCDVKLLTKTYIHYR